MSGQKKPSSDHKHNDDFRLINGINKNIKARLHAVGIHTFQDLARLTSNEIIAMLEHPPDLTTDRINRENWIEQARKLINVSNTEEVPFDSEISKRKPIAGERLAQFALELTLNADNTVKRTRVLHLESDEKDAESTWTGWQENQLLKVITQRAKLALTDSKPIHSEKKDGSLDSESLDSRQRPVTSGSGRKAFAEGIEKYQDDNVLKQPPQPLHPQSIQIVRSKRNSTLSVLPQSESFSVQLLLDQNEITSIKSDSCAYTAVIYAKNIGKRNYLMLGKSQGIFAPEEHITIMVEKNCLDLGAYRMGVSLTINPLNAEAGLRGNITTYFDGGLIQVY